MPLYTYICDECGLVKDKIQSMNDYHVLTCSCGSEMHQDWASKRVKFGGEMPTTGGFAPFHDGETGLEVTSQKMWDDVRKRTGRIQFEQDSDHKSARSEAAYLEKHASPTDHREAIVEGEKVMRNVHRKKAEERSSTQLKHQRKAILQEMSKVDLAQE